MDYNWCIVVLSVISELQLVCFIEWNVIGGAEYEYYKYMLNLL